MIWYRQVEYDDTDYYIKQIRQDVEIVVISCWQNDWDIHAMWSHVNCLLACSLLKLTVNSQVYNIFKCSSYSDVKETNKFRIAISKTKYRVGSIYSRIIDCLLW